MPRPSCTPDGPAMVRGHSSENGPPPALPTKVRYGTWRAYIDQTKRFSLKTRPQWIDPFTITRVVGGN